MDFTKKRLDVLMKEFKGQIVKKAVSLDGFLYADSGYTPIGAFPSAKSLEPYDGKNWASEKRGNHAWFVKDVVLPDGFNPKNTEIVVNTCDGGWFFGNPQMMVFIDGKLHSALDWQHLSFTVLNKRKFNLSIYAYIGKYIAGGAPDECFISGDVTFNATMIEKDRAVEKLYYDLHVPYMALNEIALDSPCYFNILDTLNKIFNVVDFRRIYSQEYYDSIATAQSIIDDFYKNNKQLDGPTVTLVGQTHIDVAWLWTKKQVREKALRSFSTVIDLMNRYPEFKFMQSQPVLYEYCKQECPELYSRIKAMVSNGRWEPEGALWVESDCNLLSGESMVRQIMFGKRFFKKEFDVDSKIAWLPDTFGFSGTLPQIFAKSGVKAFITSKLTWNEVNTQPYDTFWWKGVDGSKIFGYFLTAQDFQRNGVTDRLTIYNARLTVTQVFGTVNRYEPKRLNNDVVLTYGFGDGGGGPTAEYLEVMSRLNNSIKGVPKTESAFLGEFIDKIYAKLKDDKRLPVWTGELYFEHHRGTYTSIAKIKKDNRKSEFMLQNAEINSAIANVLWGAYYPQSDINSCWKVVLTNQFHDVLPGSSIYEVYRETQGEYLMVDDCCTAIEEEFFERLCENVCSNDFIVLNGNGNSGLCYGAFDGVYYEIESTAQKGYKIFNDLSCDCKVVLSDNSIENDCIKVTFDTNFEIESIFDKETGKELVKDGYKANSFIVFEDYPGGCDAWEIQSYYKEKAWRVGEFVSAEKVVQGARAGFIVKKKYLDSISTQTITVYNSQKRVDFDTVIDWKEPHSVLKVEFPVDINFNKSVADMQFGKVERSAITNTSWDEARFETCAHKYVDVSDGGYGVSLINDCKYGYDVLDGILRLTVLKCASFPFPEGDLCEHKFTYSLFLHDGALSIETDRLAYSINNPVRIVKGTGKVTTAINEFSLVTVHSDSVIVETVKKAEDDGDIIVRLYESQNSGCTAKVEFGFDAISACETDLMENHIRTLELVDNSVSIKFKPFEIITLKVKRN